jgi:hypothetical protein
MSIDEEFAEFVAARWASLYRPGRCHGAEVVERGWSTVTTSTHKPGGGRRSWTGTSSLRRQTRLPSSPGTLTEMPKSEEEWRGLCPALVFVQVPKAHGQY